MGVPVSSSKQSAEKTRLYSRMAMASQMYYRTAIDLGWRLAITVLLPLFIGIWLDERFKTAPTWTLTTFILAVAGACLVVSRMISTVNNKTTNLKIRGSKW